MTANIMAEPAEGGMSSRMRDVTRLIALGKSNEEIAYLLDLAEGTVKLHVHRAMQRVGAPNRVKLALWAVCVAGLVTPVEVSQELSYIGNHRSKGNTHDDHGESNS